MTLLSNLDRQIDGRMVDISATGMRFIAGENIPPDEVVAVDFEDHLAVATVRNTQRYGDKFSVGTSRIHAVPKDQLPEGKPQYEHIRALLEEKGWLVEIETEDTPPEAAPAPTPAAEVAAPVAEVAPSQVPEVAPVEEVAAAAEVAPLTVEAGPSPEGPGARGQGPVPAPIAEEVLPTQEPEPALEAGTEAEGQGPVRVPAAEEVVPAQEAVPALEIAPVPEIAPVEKGGEPPVKKEEAPIVVAPPPPPTVPVQMPATSSHRGLVAAAVVVLVIVVGAALLRLRPQASAHGTVAAAPAVIPAAAVNPPAPVEPTPAAIPTEPAAAQPASGPHSVHLATLNASWISASADGKAVVAKMFQNGDVSDFQFSKVAFIHLGNSSEVEISVDGNAVQLTEFDSGPLRLIKLTPDGAHILPWSNGDPPASPTK